MSGLPGRRGIAANTSFALAGDVAAKAGAVAITALAARRLPVDEFALWASAIATASLAAAVLDGGAQVLLTRDGADADERGRLFRALTVGRAPFAVALLIGLPLLGILQGHGTQAAAVALLAVIGAVTLSLVGLIRSSEDMLPEATSRLLTALLGVAGGAVVLLLDPRSDLLLASAVAAAVVGLWPLARRARRVSRIERGVGATAALRSAVPLGLMGVATLVFYRSGTIGLSVLSTSEATATFAVAANVGFGLLVLPNAITSGLLPRLSAQPAGPERTATTRKALQWTLGLTAPTCLLAAVLGVWLLPLVFGPTYADAAVPLTILAAAVVVIAWNGTLGTALVAAGALRLLGVQVAVSLAVNLALVAALAGPYGAAGAALATLGCELVGAVILVVGARRALPGVLSLRGRACVPWGSTTVAPTTVAPRMTVSR